MRGDIKIYFRIFFDLIIFFSKFILFTFRLSQVSWKYQLSALPCTSFEERVKSGSFQRHFSHAVSHACSQQFLRKMRPCSGWKLHLSWLVGFYLIKNNFRILCSTYDDFQLCRKIHYQCWKHYHANIHGGDVSHIN